MEKKKILKKFVKPVVGFIETDALCVNAGAHSGGTSGQSDGDNYTPTQTQTAKQISWDFQGPLDF